MDTAEFNRQIDELYAIQQKDPSEAAKDLQSMGIIPPQDPSLLDIPGFGFGAVAPQFGEMMLTGVTMNGGFVEYNPGNFYVAGAVGKSSRDVDLSGLSLEAIDRNNPGTAPQFFRNVYTARLGYGRKEGNIVIASLMYSLDDEQSRILEGLVDTAGTRLAPQENFILGLSGRVGFDTLELALEGQVNVSLFNDPFRGNVPQEARLRSFVSSIFGRRNTTAQSLGDIAYSGSLTKLLFGRSGRLSASVRMVGPSYRSTGVAGLRSDVFGYDTRYEHEFLGGQINLNGLFGREETGFVVADPERSVIVRAGAGGEFRFRGLPSLQLAFAQTKQTETSPDGSLIRSNRVNQYTIGSRLLTRFGTIRDAISASFSLQDNRSSDALTDFRTHTITLTDRLSFAYPLSLILTGSQNQTGSATDSVAQSGISSVDFSLLWAPIQAWEIVAGVTVGAGKESRTRGAYASLHAPLWSAGDAELRCEVSKFDDSLIIARSFTDRVLRLVTRVNL
jgi:hypothetical protein